MNHTFNKESKYQSPHWNQDATFHVGTSWHFVIQLVLSRPLFKRTPGENLFLRISENFFQRKDSCVFSFAKNTFRLGYFHADFMLCLYFHEYLLLDFRMINSQWVSLNFSEFLQCFSSQYQIQGKLASSTRIRISFQRCQKIHTYL